ncbi:hypothetical protein ANN_10390 [Periplaneta americana]|uniref:DUF4817 domain-containing protein n=1 Tax=Periplaneta americana TaxID=6978 RepID=A0ABQ8TNW1_PERAM|nr:hypothetical protein ANN_10390 [Periplaneta americana]
MDFGPAFIDIYDVVQRGHRGNPREFLRILTGVGVVFGLVDKASARRAENPGSNPGAGENFSPSLPSKETLRGHSDSSFRGEGYIQCCVGVRLCDMYSNQELAEIHFMYGKADGNAALARRLYQERYPQRQCPDRKTFVRLQYRRGGPIAWPPRSPDLNPLDLYLWGHLKSLVYSSPVPDLESLRNLIVACSEDIRSTPGVWDRLRRTMRHRCEDWRWGESGAGNNVDTSDDSDGEAKSVTQQRKNNRPNSKASKEAIEIKLEKNNFNRDSGLQLSQAWTPALDQLRPSYNQGHEDHGPRTATDSNRRNRARRPPNFTQ